MSDTKVNEAQVEVINEQDKVHRYDATAFTAKPTRTTQGFLKVSANVSRTGIFKYYNADGSVRRELRLPEEVFNNQALSTLSSAPITYGHPVEDGKHVLVNAKNAKKFTVGMLSEQIHTDDKFIAANLLITDSDVIDAVEQGHRREVSLGYSCDLEERAGEWNGEAYDAIQRNIVYNHAAIVARGRAGSEVSIRMDAKDAMTEYPETIYNNEETKMDNKTIKVDGADFEVSASAAQAIEAAFAKHTGEMTALKAELDNTKGQLDATKEELALVQKARADAEDPAVLQAAIEARVSLLSKAKAIVGEGEDLSKLSDRQIKEKAIALHNPEMKFDGLSDDYVNGRFDTVVENHSKTQESLNVAKAAVINAASQSQVSSDTLRSAHLQFLNKKGAK